MPTMTDRKKKKDGEEKKPAKRSGVPLHVWIDPELAEALREYLESSEPSVFKTAAVESALREFLRGKGHWPRKKPTKQDE